MRGLFLGVFAVALFANAPLHAAHNGWDPAVITFGEKRRQIEQTPILHRKNRPFHFYGNTVRRRYYEGRTLPSLREVQEGTRVLIFRRS